MAKKLLKSENKNQDISFKVKTIDTENNTVEGVFSAEIEDRQGETVVQSGWLLDNYKKNPIVLWAHCSDEPPIAKMLEIGVNPGTNQLEGKMQFAVEEYDFAQTIFNLIVGGYQNAFSAGFTNNKYEIDQQNDKVYLIENELLEMSVVPVPANQLALAKTKGIDTSKYEEKEKILVTDEDKPDADADDPDDLSDLDDGSDDESKALETISRSNIETIRKAISTLTEVLNAQAETDTQAGSKVEHPVKNAGGKNKVSVHLLNRAIRELLAVKKNYK